MSRLMRCLYCGVLQDEPAGVKACARCGGELAFEDILPPTSHASYIQVQLELDQVKAPADGQNVERYLLATLRAPKTLPAAETPPVATGRAPMGFSAVLDVSGSMRGEKLDQAKEATRQALQRLHDGDVFSLVTFANAVACVCEPLPLNSDTRSDAAEALRQVRAGGMTALADGLDLGIQKTLARKQETNLVLLLSDGQANVGDTDIEKVGYRGFDARQRGLIVSTLGVGNDYNEALMAEIATQGGGRFYHVASAHQIAAYLTGELGEVAALAAREVKIHLNLPAGAMLMPLSAAYAVRQNGSVAVIEVGDLPADLELEIPLRLTLPAQAEGVKVSIEGRLTHISPAGNALEAPLTRVTVRFVAPGAFALRDGVVEPVARQVLAQLKATSVLSFSRAAAAAPGQAAHQADTAKNAVRHYAALLGEQAAEDEARELDAQFVQMQAAPMAAKAMVSDAFARTRGAKKFSQD